MIQVDQNNKFRIYPVNVLKDNIVWIWVFNNEAVVVDPSISQPIKNWLKEKKLNLLAILQTHHHDDHTGGTKELIRQWPKAEVIASKADINRIPFQTISVKDKDELMINGYQITVIEIPGHTKFHIAFHLKNRNNKQSVLFCGDTLFAGGCGRLLEGTAENMFLSLKRLNALPPETEIYCGHEYTEANLRWAESLFPNNFAIKKRLELIIKQRKLRITTLPSTLEEERKTNLFIRARDIDEFSYLRHHKDNWSG
tara:strand:- start:530 stop:1291 length:762 start_codon:yes stop_codon:yes gene_type:complete